jgi:hypothetical protein
VAAELCHVDTEHAVHAGLNDRTTGHVVSMEDDHDRLTMELLAVNRAVGDFK